MSRSSTLAGIEDVGHKIKQFFDPDGKTTPSEVDRFEDKIREAFGLDKKNTKKPQVQERKENKRRVHIRLITLYLVRLLTFGSVSYGPGNNTQC